MAGMNAMLELQAVVLVAERWLMAVRGAVEAEVVAGIVIPLGNEQDEVGSGDRTFETDASEPWRQVGEDLHNPEHPVHYHLILVPLQISEDTSEKLRGVKGRSLTTLISPPEPTSPSKNAAMTFVFK